VKIGGNVIRLFLDCDGVEVMTHDLIGDVIRIGPCSRMTWSLTIRQCQRSTPY